MKRYHADGGIPTLQVALLEYMNADDLKKLAKHTQQKIPTRKADIAAVIMRHLDGERLKTVWQSLDDLQRAAVAEVVHSGSTRFLADRFQAKYGRGPNWGTDEFAYFSRYDGLMYFRITPLGAHCLGAEAAYQPPPVEAKPVLSVLPNLEVTAIGAELERGDRIALDTYATQVSDFVWRLDQAKLLAAVEEGRPIDEVREFLAARSSVAIPDTVTRLLDDVAGRSAKIHDRGLARLVECADPALAALIANDSRTRMHCMPAGERHLVVPASSETAFKRTLRGQDHRRSRRHGDGRPDNARSHHEQDIGRSMAP